MRSNLTFSDGIALVRDFIQAQVCSWTENRLSCTASIALEFNPIALALFALQVRHNPLLQRLCSARRLSPERLADWRQIPALPAAAFKDYEVTSLPPPELTTLFLSSGTTEHRPSRHFHDASSLALYEASLLAWFHLHFETGSLKSGEADEAAFEVLSSGPLRRNLSPAAGSSLSPIGGEGKGEGAVHGKPRPPKLDAHQSGQASLFCLVPSPALAPHSSLVHMMDAIRRHSNCHNDVFFGQLDAEGAWQLDLPRLVCALESSVASNTPVILLATAFTFVHLLDHLASVRRRFHLPPGSCAMETGGYKGRSRTLSKAELHALIGSTLGIHLDRIVTEYGMSELSSQAYDHRLASLQSPNRSSQRIFRFPPWARALVVSPETGREVEPGETGLIRVFDLANVRSVLAIQTEDLGVRHQDGGFELLGRLPTAPPRGCSLMCAEGTHP